MANILYLSKGLIIDYMIKEHIDCDLDMHTIIYNCDLRIPFNGEFDAEKIKNSLRNYISSFNLNNEIHLYTCKSSYDHCVDCNLSIYLHLPNSRLPRIWFKHESFTVTRENIPADILDIFLNVMKKLKFVP